MKSILLAMCFLTMWYCVAKTKFFFKKKKREVKFVKKKIKKKISW